MEIRKGKNHAWKASGFRWFIFSAIVFLIFCMLTWDLAQGGFDAWDAKVTVDMAAMQDPALNGLLDAFALIGSVPALAVFCVILMAYPPSRMRYGIPATAALILSTILTMVLDLFIDRTGPALGTNGTPYTTDSFPCLSAMGCMAVFGMLYFLLWYYGRKDIKANPYRALTPEERAQYKDTMSLGMRGILMLPCMLGVFLPGVALFILARYYTTDVIISWVGGLLIVLLLMGIIAEWRWDTDGFEGPSR